MKPENPTWKIHLPSPKNPLKLKGKDLKFLKQAKKTKHHKPFKLMGGRECKESAEAPHDDASSMSLLKSAEAEAEARLLLNSDPDIIHVSHTSEQAESSLRVKL